jgi:Methyltransferase domain
MQAARRRRMAVFWSLVETLGHQPIHIVDLGGVGAFWTQHGLEWHPYVHVTVINLEPHPPLCSQVEAIVGDARELDPWADQSVDVVFSNSLVEHLGGWPEQLAFARNVRRVARNYFVQTPNRAFPLEPHFMFPGFQFLPREIRSWLVQHFALGWMPRRPNRDAALRIVDEIRLLKAAEFRALFPDALIWPEQILCLTKSFVAIGGAWHRNAEVRIIPKSR